VDLSLDNFPVKFLKRLNIRAISGLPQQAWNAVMNLPELQSALNDIARALFTPNQTQT